ncbi:DUF6491 family protein [Shewanella schlegeliana]|uniref:DUF4825 domain-containing protein n=1 Tax=Shewanella schlegeliana TaxID=190308 RepID=A0ABS1T2L0_9GAMM|nr:DUF6491 family protein [Shewanella schlegeliana]MBL4915027.1 hypothetical protein [Shewanella schlegeliana]MCL1110561.1 DUF6491 family protein [Shewanella schlegeliana]GIU32315.1 hypothetical protein TUM4433_25120 [Shewanella schlegeliana]
MRLLKLVALFFIVLLAGCASSEASKEHAAMYTFPDLEQVNSIDNFRMDGWESVDRYSIIVDSRPRQSYLLILSGGLSGLNFAQGLLVTSTLGKVEAGFDSVSTLDDPMMKAQIKRIYKLKDQQQKNEIKAKIEAFDDDK